jgi:adenylate cyclase
VVATHGGRIIKALGDEVLFVVDDAAAAAELALDLQEQVSADERLPAMRIGMAAGPIVERLGDVFGSTVNIASRLTKLCRPGWVLVDRVLSELLADNENYELKPRRPEQVRGFHHLHQWRLRRAEPEARRGRGEGRKRRAGDSRAADK